MENWKQTQKIKLGCKSFLFIQSDIDIFICSLSSSYSLILIQFIAKNFTFRFDSVNDIFLAMKRLNDSIKTLSTKLCHSKYEFYLGKCSAIQLIRWYHSYYVDSWFLQFCKLFLINEIIRKQAMSCY